MNSTTSLPLNQSMDQINIFERDLSSEIKVDTVISENGEIPPLSSTETDTENNEPYSPPKILNTGSTIQTIHGLEGDQNANDENENHFHYTYKSAIENMKDDDIGLVCFPVQKRLQVFKTGSTFTLLCVGNSGVGKTSFINSLFGSNLIQEKTELPQNYSQMPTKTTEIVQHKMELIEDGFKLKLNLIDTPGFGDYVDNRYCWYPIAKYIDEQYRRVVYQENQPNRSNMVNGEVHVCLYFINPSAVGLSELDIEAMKNLATRVNLIPIISKADGFTSEEINAFKQRIKNTMQEEDIPICELIDSGSKAKRLIDEMPFTVINSIEKYENENGDLVRGRKYRWGISEVENPKHCDFLKLREFLIEMNMGDLISSTDNYYENYRRDFMRYRLGKSIQMALSLEESESLGVEKYDKEVIIPSSRGSWKSVNKESGPIHPNLDMIINSKDSIDVLNLLNKLSLKETEKEMVELNPSYLELEKQVKKKFTGIVHSQNQKFKDWKKALFEKQDKFNKDIEQVHNRLLTLQEEVKEMEYLKQV